MIFQVGDRVKVKRGVSGDSEIYDGQIGTIIKIVRSSVQYGDHVLLDIEKTSPRGPGGIYCSELELVSSSVKKEVKVFGIVSFCESINKRSTL